MDEDFIKKYGALLILILVLVLFSFNCRVDRLTSDIEELQDKIKNMETDREKFLDSHCLKNLTPYCVKYNAQKKLINDIFTKVVQENN